jgi:hypothetical protein
VPLSDARISLTLHQTSTDLDLKIENPGAPFLLNFSPTLPLGATVDHAEINHRASRIAASRNLPDTVANLSSEIPHGVTQVHLSLRGGLTIIPSNSAPFLGDPSRGIHIVDVSLVGDSLNITADVPVDRTSTLDVATNWALLSRTNASVETISPGLDRITFQPPSNSQVVEQTQRVQASFEIRR